MEIAIIMIKPPEKKLRTGHDHKIKNYFYDGVENLQDDAMHYNVIMCIH